MHSKLGFGGAFVALILAAGAPAPAAVRMLIDHVDPLPEKGSVRLALTVLNLSDAPVDQVFPDSMPVQLKLGDATTLLTAFRDAATPPVAKISGKGFGEAIYRLDLPKDYAASGATALLSLGSGQTEIALALPPQAAGNGTKIAVEESPTPAIPTPAQTADDRPFFNNFTAYEPIYAVYGNASRNDTRLQISFKYQLFGDANAAPNDRRWIDNFYLAYTQRMFADVAEKSNPIRAIDFQPEFFYLWQPRAVGGGTALGGQLGLRHISNGKGGVDSRSFNAVFVRPSVGWKIGGQQLTISPTAWLYLGKDTYNPDIAHYRGNSGLGMTFGSEKGLMLTADSRFNFGSGKSAVDGTISYPLSNLIPGYNMYIFVQGFTGYGEALLDYDRRSSRARIGIGFVR